MMRDFQLLVRLRVRHARTFLLRLAYLAGTDPSVDRDASDRVYQLYVAGALLICAALLWFALLDVVEKTFVAVGSLLGIVAVSALLAMAVAVFVHWSVRALRSAPLRLSHPDIAYVASSPISARSLVMEAAGASLLAAAVIGALAGYLLGFGLEAALGGAGWDWFAASGTAAAGFGAAVPDPAAAAAGPPGSSPLASFAFELGEVSPAMAALACSALFAAVAGGSWAIGVVRLASRRRPQRAEKIVGIVVACALGLAGTAGAFVCGPILAAAGSAGFAILGAAALACLVVEAAVLAVLSPRVDMVAVVQESALAVELDPFGVFSALDPDVQSDYRRRIKVARRGPVFRLPAAQGRFVFIARSALSLVRQFEGLAGLVVLGAATTPLGVAALFGAGAPVTFLFWLMLLVLVRPSGPREASRAFRDDMRVRLVRDQLPFSVFELLVLDSLPAFALVAVLTCAVVPFAVPPGVPLAAALALGVVTNAATLLCAGLDAVRMSSKGLRPWSEGGLAMLVAATAIASTFELPWLTVAAAVAVCVGVALIVLRGVERAR